jgi:voltage-gated potassium channel
MDTTDRRRASASSNLQSLKVAIQHIEHGRDQWALRWQALLAFIDVTILAFFILGPYLRAGPSYLIIYYTVAVWIGGELLARALAAPSIRTFLKKPMTWIDIVILATLLFPDLLFNFAFLRAMRIWAIGKSQLLCEILRLVRNADCSGMRPMPYIAKRAATSSISPTKVTEDAHQIPLRLRTEYPYE